MNEAKATFVALVISFPLMKFDVPIEIFLKIKGFVTLSALLLFYLFVTSVDVPIEIWPSNEAFVTLAAHMISFSLMNKFDVRIKM